jgi:mono/diheme cytochrome c family protein
VATALLCVLTLLAALAAGPAFAQEKPAVPPALERLPVPDDASRAALADVEGRLARKQLSPTDALFLRYVWVRNDGPDAQKVVALTMNYVSTNPNIARPLPVAGGMLALVDLRSFAPKAEDTNRLLRVWEELRFNPEFSLLLTPATLERAADEGQIVRVKSRGTVQETRKVKKVWPGGKDARGQEFPKGFEYEAEETVEVPAGTSTWRSVKVADAARAGDVLRFNAPHLDAPSHERLQDLLNTEAPVVEWRYLVARFLSTIRGKGVYRQVFGGLYYDASGIVRKPARGTAEDALFESLGLGKVDAGFTAKDLFERLDGDSRVGLARSNVTGKPRRIDLFQHPNVRDFAGLISVTHDPSDDTIDVDEDPLYNLAEFKDAAREIIWVKTNGLHGFALTNAAGDLQDEAPPDIVRDHEIPAPFTGRLECAVSCIRCHNLGGDDGWKPAPNDVQDLIRKDGGVFDDTGLVKKPNVRGRKETVERLAAQYRGDLSKMFRRGREDYAEVLFRVTGPWFKDSKAADAKLAARMAGEAIANAWRRYKYDLVDARSSLAEVGIGVAAPAARLAFAAVFRPASEADNGEFVAEDPAIKLIARRAGVTRPVWALTYSFQMTRAAKARAELKFADPKPAAVPGGK